MKKGMGSFKCLSNLKGMNVGKTRKVIKIVQYDINGWLLNDTIALNILTVKIKKAVTLVVFL